MELIVMSCHAVKEELETVICGMTQIMRSARIDCLWGRQVRTGRHSFRADQRSSSTSKVEQTDCTESVLQSDSHSILSRTE